MTIYRTTDTTDNRVTAEGSRNIGILPVMWHLFVYQVKASQKKRKKFFLSHFICINLSNCQMEKVNYTSQEKYLHSNHSNENNKEISSMHNIYVNTIQLILKSTFFFFKGFGEAVNGRNIVKK